MTEQSAIALVTGASSGLGEEFVCQLAPRCGTIIAVARRADRLRALAERLREDVRVLPLEADLCVLEGQARVLEAIRQTGPLDYLVNNAGFGTFGPFAESDIDRELDMVRLHVEATLLLTRAALPAMRERRCGSIINLASIGAFLSMKHTAVYGATKAFLHSFSLSLRSEVRAEGIRVQSLCPGLTHTGIHEQPEFTAFDKAATPQELWMDASAVVRESLEALEWDQAIVVTGAVNRRMVADALGRTRDSIDE